MLPTLIDIAPFQDAIQQGGLIVTPNHRLAAKILEAWSTHKRESDFVAPTPRVYAIDHWIKHLWDELVDQNHPLNRGLSIVGEAQSHYYWQQALSSCNPELSSRYVNMASETLEDLEHWGLSLHKVDEQTNAFNQFKHWTSVYRNLLKDNQLITHAQSWQIIIKAYEKNIIQPEQKIYTYGFQSPTPLTNDFLTAATREVMSIKPDNINKTFCSVAVKDGDGELVNAIHWAFQQLDKNPNQRLGIVIPNLKHSLSKVSRLVEKTFTSRSKTAVNISAGVPIAQTNMIATALSALSFMTMRKSLHEILELVYSPYWLFDQLPIQVRVNIEHDLRKSRRLNTSFNEFCLICLADKYQTADCKPLEALGKLRDEKIQLRGATRSFSQWADIFKDYLELLGWPGPSTLQSIEYQQREQWYKLLESFCCLDSLDISIDFNGAVKQLILLAGNTVFHQQTADAPIQILGMLEGSGLRFDQLWITGMDSRSMPAPTASNPLLPARFQRQHAMPRSLPERELEIAQTLLAEYKSNSQNIVVSFPQSQADEDLEPSPLIKHYDRQTLNQLMVDQTDKISLKPDITELVEDKAPAYDQAIEIVSTGSSLLQNQAACPFNAFAIHRLKAQPMEEPDNGLSASDRGSIVHQILFEFWQDTASSEGLHRMDEGAKRNKISATVNSVLHQWSSHHSILRGQTFRQLEQTRLEKLVGEWVEFECSRQPFVVQSLELDQSIEFPGLCISMRFDRVDKIGNETLIIDYKTGNVTPRHWLGERPRDPQLPLYVLASSPSAQGCAYAQVRAGNITFSGIDNGTLLPDSSPHHDWQETLHNWHSSITNLAEEFVSGDTSVIFYNQDIARYQSYLAPLNRSAEQSHIKELVNRGKKVL